MGPAWLRTALRNAWWFPPWHHWQTEWLVIPVGHHNDNFIMQDIPARDAGPWFNEKNVFPAIGIFIIKIRWLCHHSFIMGISILASQNFYIEAASRMLSVWWNIYNHCLPPQVATSDNNVVTVKTFPFVRPQRKLLLNVTYMIWVVMNWSFTWRLPIS